MPDLALEVIGVRGPVRHAAARAAVLGPLVPGYGSLPVGKALARVRRYWQVRAVQLYTAGWSKVVAAAADPKLALWYLRNCPPVGVLVRQLTRRCTQPRVCPFCWGREVALAGFSFLENLCYGPPVPHPRQSPPPVELVAFSTRRRLGLAAGASADRWVAAVRASARPGGVIRALVEDRAVRRAEVAALGAAAAFVTHRLSFAPAGRQLWVDRCGLALVPRPAAGYRDRVLAALGPAAPRPADVKVRALGRPSRRNLFDATRWALYYPRGMMFHPPGPAVALLDGLAEARVRLTARYGPRSQKLLFQQIGEDTRLCDPEDVSPSDD